MRMSPLGLAPLKLVAPPWHSHHGTTPFQPILNNVTQNETQ